LRESDLFNRRQAFETSPQLHKQFWHQVGFVPCPPDTLVVSLFAYENPAIVELLRVWENAETPVCCLVPISRALAQIEAFCATPLKAGDRVARGALEIRVLPFVPQNDYDTLLWACDINFARGEDSFVRAQWAAKPMVWHIYPQQEEAHRLKLDAFLDTYCLDLPETAAESVRRFWHAWNFGLTTATQWETHWRNFAEQLHPLRTHTALWSQKLAEQEDLSTALVRFCHSKI
jgi:uncharacterized repeat protein (TIGR03837 family)